MAHINRQRQITLARNFSLNQLMPAGQLPSNFAVFCGTTDQRSTIGLHAVQQCVGTVGVVFIHDDPFLADQLNTIQRNGTNTQLYYPNRIITQEHLNYDPLYGLGEASILDIIVPPSSDGLTTPNVDSIRARLADYLAIMEYQFKLSPGNFGNYPYNLDLLVQLTQMTYNQLEEAVLNYLPADMGSQLKARLSDSNVQQSVRDAVQKFRTLMQRYLWQPRGATRHTRMSIYESVINRHIISIYVPNSVPEILDYIDCELQALAEARIPYFLMESGINLSRSERMRTRFLNEHAQLNYRTAILSGSPTSFISTDSTDFAQLTSQYRNVIALQCSSAAEAELFSQATATYYRRVTTNHQERSRQAFHLFPTFSRGHNVVEQEERSVRVNELTDLHNGALIFTQGEQYPVLVNNFNLR